MESGIKPSAVGDPGRAAYVGKVLGNFDKVLHLHHDGEDQLMYPQLAERAPGCALHVAQMLEQHRQVTQRLESIEPVRLRWIDTADPEVSREPRRNCRRGATHGIDQLDKKFLVASSGWCWP